MRIGIVGGGQLAMMMSDASDGLGLDVTALASRADDPIFSRVPQALVGDARSAEDLRRLADQTDVLTFDHELVDVVVVADKPFYIEPLFTRDPRHIKPVHVLMAMMAIRGIYEKHNVQSLNHGIGFNTAAIELILPTYGESLGLKGKICRNWTLNPHPTLIPAIETGWVESVHCFGTELGMEGYIAQRPDVFFTGRDGSMRSNRMMCQLAGQYAVDLFIGATLQVDGEGHSSTVTRGRLAGFGGAPNMGHDPRGRRHSTPAWLDMRSADSDAPLLERGKKLVVQMVETFQEGGKPTFVEQLDAVEVAKKSGMPLAPIMIYGDDVTHLLTEEGIAYLYKARSLEERQAMIAAVAGVTAIGLRHNPKDTERMRREGLIALPEDLGIRRTDASRDGSLPGTTYRLRSQDDVLAVSTEFNLGAEFGDTIKFGPRVGLRDQPAERLAPAAQLLGIGMGNDDAHPAAAHERGDRAGRRVVRMSGA